MDRSCFLCLLVCTARRGVSRFRGCCGSAGGVVVQLGGTAVRVGPFWDWAGAKLYCWREQGSTVGSGGRSKAQLRSCLIVASGGAVLQWCP